MSDAFTKQARSARRHQQFAVFGGKRRTAECTGHNCVDPRPVDRKVERKLLAEGLTEKAERFARKLIFHVSDAVTRPTIGTFVCARDMHWVQKHYY